MNYLKNPIAIGVLSAAATYGYLWWDNENKHKKNPKAEKRSVSFITPAVVGVIVWFLSSYYFDSSPTQRLIAGGEVENKYESPQVDGGNTQSVQSSANKSYYLVGKNNIRLPATDVFLDLANFD